MALTREQIEGVRKEAEAYKAATGQAGQAMITLWQARIDMAIAAGVAETVDDLIAPPRDMAAWNGNCGCLKEPAAQEVLRATLPKYK